MFEQMKASIQKFHGEQAIFDEQSVDEEISIKVEPTTTIKIFGEKKLTRRPLTAKNMPIKCGHRRTNTHEINELMKTMKQYIMAHIIVVEINHYGKYINHIVSFFASTDCIGCLNRAHKLLIFHALLLLW